MMGFIEIYWVLLFSSRFYWVTRDRIEFDSYFFFLKKISAVVSEIYLVFPVFRSRGGGGDPSN